MIRALSVLAIASLLISGCGGGSSGGGGGGLPNITISVDSVSIAEGDIGTADLIFTITISEQPAAGNDVTVDCDTQDDTAEDESGSGDYISHSEALTFTNGGSLTQQVTVTVNGDTAAETDERLFLNLSNPVNGTITKDRGAGVITDDDRPTLSIDDPSVVEGDAGGVTLTFTVTISAEPAAGYSATVDYTTMDNSAQDQSGDNDYNVDSDFLTFVNGGSLTQQITVVVNGDAVAEGHETLYVLLSNPVNAVLADDSGTGTITDDDFSGVYYVDPTGANTTGLTWANAFNTVQAAVDAAEGAGSGHVWVAAAAYTNGGGTGPVLTMKSNGGGHW